MQRTDRPGKQQAQTAVIDRPATDTGEGEEEERGEQWPGRRRRKGEERGCAGSGGGVEEMRRTREKNT